MTNIYQYLFKDIYNAESCNEIHLKYRPDTQE
jgi:hypothetical protein